MRLRPAECVRAELLEPCGGKARVLRLQSLDLLEDEVVLLVDRVVLRFVRRDGGMLGAIALRAHAAVRIDRSGDEDHDRRRSDADRDAVLRDPALDELPRRVLVRWNELAGGERAQIVGELLRVGIAIVALEGHRALDDRDELGWDIGRDCIEPLALTRGNCLDHLVARRAGDRWCAGEQRIDEGAERVDIGALVGHFAACLLRCHVRGRAHHGAVLCECAVARADAAVALRRCALDHGQIVLLRAQIFGEAPVDHDGLAERAEQHVARLQVAVNDAFVVCVREGIAHGDCMGYEREAIAERARAFEHDFERATTDALHRVERASIPEHTCVVDAHDRRVL